MSDELTALEIASQINVFELKSKYGINAKEFVFCVEYFRYQDPVQAYAVAFGVKRQTARKNVDGLLSHNGIRQLLSDMSDKMLMSAAEAQAILTRVARHSSLEHFISQDFVGGAIHYDFSSEEAREYMDLIEDYAEHHGRMKIKPYSRVDAAEKILQLRGRFQNINVNIDIQGELQKLGLDSAKVLDEATDLLEESIIDAEYTDAENKTSADG